MAAIAADRNLLFGLLALQNGLIDQGQLVAAFQAWTLRQGPRPGRPPRSRSGDLERRPAGRRRGAGGPARRRSTATSRRAWPPSRPAGRPARAWPELGDPEIEAHARPSRLRPRPRPVTRTPTAPPAYSVGAATTDGQRFRVLRPHARGGLGAVFVALDSELHREVALKQILDQHADDPTSRQRFLLEAEITGGLEHPGIVPVYGLGTYADGRPYYAMRFIRGDSLKEADRALPRRRGARRATPAAARWSCASCSRRFIDVCNAIDYAHSRGVLHRDIKPGNIMSASTARRWWSTGAWPRPIGPGRARRAGERTLVPSSASGSAETLPGSALGTPAYMSPEQAARRPRPARARGPTSTAWARRSTAC